MNRFLSQNSTNRSVKTRVVEKKKKKTSCMLFTRPFSNLAPVRGPLYPRISPKRECLHSCTGRNTNWIVCMYINKNTENLGKRIQIRVIVSPSTIMASALVISLSEGEI